MWFKINRAILMEEPGSQKKAINSYGMLCTFLHLHRSDVTKDSKNSTQDYAPKKSTRK